MYGSSDRVGAVRVEISRLRKLLGDCIETEHYRLRPGVSSDVAQVCGLLHRGDVREAAARYPGPLLPRSTAPGVIREREALEGWLRQSVMSSGDRDALWEWLQTLVGLIRPGGLAAAACQPRLPGPAPEPGGVSDRATADATQTTPKPLRRPCNGRVTPARSAVV